MTYFALFNSSHVIVNLYNSQSAQAKLVFLFTSAISHKQRAVIRHKCRGITVSAITLLDNVVAAPPVAVWKALSYHKRRSAPAPRCCLVISSVVVGNGVVNDVKLSFVNSHDLARWIARGEHTRLGLWERLQIILGVADVLTEKVFRSHPHPEFTRLNFNQARFWNFLPKLGVFVICECCSCCFNKMEALAVIVRYRNACNALS